MLVQSERSFDVDLESALKTYLFEKKEVPKVHVINRLDRPVSGLVLFAKNKDYAAKLSREMQNKGICKEYYAVVCGSMRENKGILQNYLIKDAKTNTSKITNSSDTGAKEAKLEYEAVATKKVVENGEELEVTLVRIHLITGRHHQIRVQFAGIGNPLLGDTKYNPRYAGKKGWQNIALCSYHLEFLGKNFQIKPSGDGFAYFEKELETI